MSKTTLFATCGLVGALISSVVAEALYALLPSSEPPPVHVAFVLDNSSSMTSLIEGLKGGITSFVNSFEPKGLKAKVGLIAFSDTYSGEPPIQLNFNGAAYTADTALFSRTMQSEVKLRDGGDGPETGLSALVQAAAMPTDEGADKVIVLITDAPAKLPDNGYASSADAATALAPLGVTQINFVVDPLSSREYTGLRGKIEGSTVEIGPAAEGGFQLALPKIGEDIANRIANLQGTGGVRKKDTGILFVIVALASGVVASGIAVWLIGAQNRYLGRLFLTPPEAARGLAGGFVAGAAGGLAGQALVTFAGSGGLVAVLLQIVGWTILGALIGAGLSTFVPNLHRERGALGGAIGGAVGAVLFRLSSEAVQAVAGQTPLADALGRILGWSFLGLCIGVAIVAIEQAFREAWVKVHYGPHESRVVGLGAKDVTFGSDRERCTVYVPGAEAVALRYRMENGEVTVEGGGRPERVGAGDRRTVGNLSVELMGQAAAAPAALKPAIGPYRLTLTDGTRIPLGSDATIPAGMISGLAPADGSGICARVVERPGHPGVLGLRNDSKESWTVRNADGEVKTVATGKTLPLQADLQVKFGLEARGRIESGS